MLIGDWGQFEISLRTRKEAKFTKCTLVIVVPFSWMVKLIWKFVQYQLRYLLLTNTKESYF